MVKPCRAWETRLCQTYWEIGGTGGPAGATGAGCGTEAVTDGGGDAADGPDDPPGGSGVALEAAVGAAGEACGAGATDETGSGRSAGVSPLPVCFGASILAASDLPSPRPFAPSGLPSYLVSFWGLSSCTGSRFGGSSLAASALPVSGLGSSSPPGLPLLLSLCLPADLRPSGPRSLAA